MVYCLRRCEKIPWVQFVLFLGPYKMVRQVKKVDYRAICTLRFYPILGGSIISHLLSYGGMNDTRTCNLALQG